MGIRYLVMVVLLIFGMVACKTTNAPTQQRRGGDGRSCVEMVFDTVEVEDCVSLD